MTGHIAGMGGHAGLEYAAFGGNTQLEGFIHLNDISETRDIGYLKITM